MIKIERLYDSLHVIGPQLRVSVTLSRLIGEPMASYVNRNKPIVIGQCRIHLSSPGEPTLRKAMDKYNRMSVRVARFNEVQLNASPAAHHVMFHCIAPLLVANLIPRWVLQ